VFSYHLLFDSVRPIESLVKDALFNSSDNLVETAEHIKRGIDTLFRRERKKTSARIQTATGM
jgi:hypothetical protein